MFKLLKKDVLKHRQVLGIGYCQAQHLLRHQTRMGYTTGIYGWNCDIYNINRFIITTGYRYINKGFKNTYQIVAKYEAQARIINNSDINYNDKVKKIDNLLIKMIEEIKGLNTKI